MNDFSHLTPDEIVRDKEALKCAVEILAKSKRCVAALQTSMNMGFAKAGRLYEAVCELPEMKKNGGIEWLRQAPDNYLKVLDSIDESSLE